MDTKDVQQLLTDAGYYRHGVDGVWGDKTYDAARKVTDQHVSELVGYSKWQKNHFIVGAAQLILKHAGFAPGEVDGLIGHNTSEAYEEYKAQKAGTPRVIDRTPPVEYNPVSGKFPKQSGCVAFYGQPGLPGSAAETAMQKKLVYIDLPFAFRIDWNLSEKVNRIRLHSKCSSSAKSAYEEAIKHYGQSQFCALGLDRFAGGYMPRKMRGGTTWSMHAYGCAIDTYAAPNGLNVRKPKALFSGKDYDAWFNIWEAAGWTSLGRAIDRDYMHVQAASL